jgi:hypothetical protein
VAFDQSKVEQFLEDALQYCERGAFTYGELTAAAERLHLHALARRFGGNEHAVADYVEGYGEHVSSMLTSGQMRLNMPPQITLH